MDHALEVLKAITAVLQSECPLAGGWLAVRVQEPSYPFGTIDITSSEPLRGQKYYGERHTGVVAIWSKTLEGRRPDPARVFQLCAKAHRALGAAVYGGDLQITSLAPGIMTPRSDPDGATFGRSFTFTAVTHEVEHG